MSELDRRMKQAFDDVRAPDSAKHQTLAFIEGLRSEVERAAAQAPVPANEAISSASQSPKQGVGDERGEAPVRRERFKAWRTRRTLFACAACLALLAVCWGGYRLYAQPTAYVGIDVNPSVELSVNRFGFVVDARGVNDDGRALLESVSLANLRYEEALSALTQSEAFAPYRQEDAFVEISVASDDERQSQELYAQSSDSLAALPCRGACHAVDAATRESAASSGMGMGRYRAATELMELDPNVTLEECANMSMRQLRDHIEACRHADGASSEADASGQGGGSGQGHGRQGGQGSGHGKGAGRGCDTPGSQ